MTLFDEGQQHAPLAVRMRPNSVEDVVGQESALSVGTPLHNLLTGNGSAISVILWGPPGTGKTTLASLVSVASGRAFSELSAVTSGVKDVREVIEQARQRSSVNNQGTVLFIDEVHRFSKSQQDALLPAVENGWVTLIGATTENPSFSVISPLISRSLVVTLAPLTDDAIALLLNRALTDRRGFDGRFTISPESLAALVQLSIGDARRGLTALEAAAIAAEADSSTAIQLVHVEQAIQHVALRYDKDGDQHYDVISAFIKSVRGSDPDAALHYLARMLEAGEDPRFVARRLMILASEDIGMADPAVLQTAVAAAQSVAIVGMPEAQIILAHATVHAALAPKSNAIVTGIVEATNDVRRGRVGSVPVWLRDAHYPGAKDHGHGEGYAYPHDLPDGVAQQEYLPEVLKGAKYYRPTQHGAEAAWSRVAQRVEELRKGEH
jgi:putative ATPase